MGLVYSAIFRGYAQPGGWHGVSPAGRRALAQLQRVTGGLGGELSPQGTTRGGPTVELRKP
jgi:hypothetical protein